MKKLCLKKKTSSLFPMPRGRTSQVHIGGVSRTFHRWASCYFFYLFGVPRMKNFIVKDDKEPINKVLKKRGKRTGQSRNWPFKSWNFQCVFIMDWKLVKKRPCQKLWKIFLHMLESFGKKEDVKKFANVWLLKDPIQKIEASTCGSLQLYLYENLFFFQAEKPDYIRTKNGQAK